MHSSLKLDKEDFLERFWQRDSLFIDGAIADFTPPISADELAGLALDAEVESRIVEYGDGQWSLHHGPFEASDFQSDNPWTLLVQAVDHYLPEVARLHQLIDFIPRWRMDDVMVSYAVDDGGVGPHYDNYDVFLLQGEGERLWKLGQACDESTPLLPHDELRLLSDFQSTEEHLLRCGDILYVPPGMAHWGVSRGESTTFSIGFRAPRVSDMVSRWADHLLERQSTEVFYRDAGSSSDTRPGEIAPPDLEQVQKVLTQALQQPLDNLWFGELVTEPRYELTPADEDISPSTSIISREAEVLVLSLGARLAWQETQEGIVVFANGISDAFPVSALPWAMQLCAEGRLEGEFLMQALGDTAGIHLLTFLREQGCIDGE
jgi:50S ribosomal protein L16 3-hydroxylase